MRLTSKKRLTEKPWTIAAIAAGTLAAFSPASFAGFTTVVPNHFGEPGQQEIISHVYQADFQPMGESFLSGPISATRLPDGVNDANLYGQQFVARVVARFSDNTQSFGVLNGATYTPVFNVSGRDYAATGSGTVTVSAGQSFARVGSSGSHSSIPSVNADGRDHVLTYEISGADPSPQWLQFWEDLNDTPGLAKGRTKSDFNDLVVQLSASGTDAGNVVPLPPAVLSGAATGAMVLLQCARVRRRKN